MSSTAASLIVTKTRTTDWAAFWTSPGCVRDVRLVCAGGAVVRWNCLAMLHWSGLIKSALSERGWPCPDCDGGGVVVMLPDVDAGILEKLLEWTLGREITLHSSELRQASKILRCFGATVTMDAECPEEIMVEEEDLESDKEEFDLDSEEPLDDPAKEVRMLAVPKSTSGEEKCTIKTTLFPCPVCPYRGSSKHHRSEHMVKKHLSANIERDFSSIIKSSVFKSKVKCSLCQESMAIFSYRGPHLSFLLHLCTKHAALERYYPDLNSFSYEINTCPRTSNVGRHKPFKCPYPMCLHGFASYSNLREHVAMSHCRNQLLKLWTDPDERPDCPLCLKVLINLSSLTKARHLGCTHRMLYNYVSPEIKSKLLSMKKNVKAYST